MSGECEQAECSICKEVTIVSREYYHYRIPCDCCNNKKNNHFEIVYYCKNCKPKPPRRISVVLAPINDISIKEHVDQINEEIRNAEDERSDIQEKCKHKKTEEVQYMTRPGQIFPVEVCSDCGVVIKFKIP